MGEYWWSAVLEGEEQIDIEQINKERSMATVDEEEHAVLDRLTFDYRQKLQGKPQSHELVRRRGHAGGGPCCGATPWVLTPAAPVWSAGHRSDTELRWQGGDTPVHTDPVTARVPALHEPEGVARPSLAAGRVAGSPSSPVSVVRGRCACLA